MCFVELEKKLRLRADREHLVQKNILPGNHVFKLVPENETHIYRHVATTGSLGACMLQVPHFLTTVVLVYQTHLNNVPTVGTVYIHCIVPIVM